MRAYFESDKITKHWLYQNLHGASEYANKAFEFVIEKWTTDVESLSAKQFQWLSTILEDCVERRINAAR